MFSFEKNKLLNFVFGLLLLSFCLVEKVAYSQLYFLPLARGQAEKKFQRYVVELRGHPVIFGIPQNPTEFLQLIPKSKKKNKTLIVAVPDPLKNSDGVELIKVEEEDLSIDFTRNYLPEKIGVHDSNFSLEGFIGEFRSRVGEISIYRNDIQNRSLDSEKKSELILKLRLACASTLSWIETYGLTNLASDLKKDFIRLNPKTTQAEKEKFEKLKADKEVKFLGPADSAFEAVSKNIFPQGVEYEVARTKNIRIFYFTKFPGAHPKLFLSRPQVSEFLEKSESFINQVRLDWASKLSGEEGLYFLKQFEKIFDSKEPFFTFYYVPSPKNPNDSATNYLEQLNNSLATADSRGIEQEIRGLVQLTVFNVYAPEKEVIGQNGIWFFPTLKSASGEYVPAIIFEPHIAHFFGEFFSNFIFQHSIGQISYWDTPWLHSAVKMHLGLKYYGVNPGFTYEVIQNRKPSRYQQAAKMPGTLSNVYLAEVNSLLFDDKMVCIHKTPLNVIFRKTYAELDFLDIAKATSFVEYLIEKWGSPGFNWMKAQNFYRIPNISEKFLKISLEHFSDREPFLASTPETFFHDLEKDWEKWTLEKIKTKIETARKAIKK